MIYQKNDSIKKYSQGDRTSLFFFQNQCEP
jgi:hypothetical protein